jgi:serine/threonine-protein kinase
MTALRHCGVSSAAVHASCGSVAFAPPELAIHGDDDGADMFGLGGTLYQLLTGSPPFGGRTTGMVMATVLLDPRTSESASPASAAVTDVILRCLEKDPADRWPDFDAMRDALNAAVRDAPPAARRRSFGLERNGLLGRVSHAIASRLRGDDPRR